MIIATIKWATEKEKLAVVALAFALLFRFFARVELRQSNSVIYVKTSILKYF